MNETLKQIIKENFKWDLSDVTIEYQQDGLTNQNYIISKDHVKYAIRVSGKNSLELGINRQAELAAMKLAATIGVGAELICFSTDTGNMITKYIDGVKWLNQDAATPENILRIAAAMKKVHALPPIIYDFSPYRDIENRIQSALKKNLELPEYLDQLLNKLYSIEEERKKYNCEYVRLCHNDPFPNNFIDDGTVRLIDWEYAGMGDLFFDLSSVCTFYSLQEKALFLKHYFGKVDAGQLQSLDQMTFVVSFWNAMWAVLQTGLQENKHDYQSMAKHIFESMEKTL